ncbi:MAG: AAA family ATPase [Candidatus Yanofskybacteria bacterium]|nr:AAA family ATPase [Candidatus Yanofskybacteria bacterium]
MPEQTQPHPLRRFIISLKLYRAHIGLGSNEKLIKFVDELVQSAERIETRQEASGRSVGLSFEFLDSVCGFLYNQLQKVTAENNKNKAEANKLLENLKSAVEEIKALQRPPHSFVFFQKLEERGGEFWIRTKDSTALVFSDELVEKLKTAKAGQKVRLNESGVAIELLDEFDKDGDMVQVLELLGDNRLRVSQENRGESIVFISPCVQEADLKIGDKVLLSRYNNLVTEKLSSSEVTELVLHKVPNYTWDDIGGLEEQIGAWRDEVETNLVDPESAKIYGIEQTKGVLITGPPGVGKTFLVKVALSETVKFVNQQTGRNIEGFYILVNGPADILRGIVGDSPRRIQYLFAEAKRRAKEGHLVFIILDEFESLFRIRGSMVLDAGVGNEDVNQLNAEMDGIEELDGVLVVALSNRADLIDPAVIRPGRFDLKIEIPRYDKKTAAKVFSKYIKPTLKFHHQYKNQDPEQTANLFVNNIVDLCYDSQRPENQLAEVIDDDSGESIVFTIGNFMSGALIKNIVSRAKKIARRRFVNIPKEQGEKRELEGLMLDDFFQSIAIIIRSEIKLPTGEQALEEWLQIEGYQHRKIRRMRFLLDKKDPSRTPERRVMS